jgi:hypothetical protein
VLPKRSFIDHGGPKLAFLERLYFRFDVCEDITDELLPYSYLDMNYNDDS